MKSLVLLTLGFMATASAGTLTNPGGSTVVVETVLYNISFLDTPVTQRVDLYSTTLNVVLNGGQIFSQSYAYGFGSAPLSTAIAQADSLLAGLGASYSAPLLVSGSSALQSSVTPPPPAYTCDTPGLAAFFTSSTTEVIPTFGPATIQITSIPLDSANDSGLGNCQLSPFFVFPGQLALDAVTTSSFLVPRNIITTDTFLTTQVYTIRGTSSLSPAPEPASLALLGAGLAALWISRFKRPQAS